GPDVDCLVVCPLLFFFFSSRRRHTRWPRDWSSDVCSSDLARSAATSTTRQPTAAATSESARRCLTGRTQALKETWSHYDRPIHRSEERRVGKECRSRWWTYH